MKKLVLTGFAVFFAQGTLIQLVVSLSLLVLYTLWMTRVQPYRNPLDNKYATISAVMLQGTPLRVRALSTACTVLTTPRAQCFSLLRCCLRWTSCCRRWRMW